MEQEVGGVTIAVTAAFTWSVAAVFYRKGEVGLKPYEANALRCFVPLITLLPLSLFFSAPSFMGLTLKTLGEVAAATIVMLVVGDTLYLESIRAAGVSIAVPVSYTFPVFTAVLAFIFLGEAFHPLTYVGVALTVGGIWLLSRRGDRVKGFSVKRGVIAGIATSLLWAISIVAYRHILYGYDPLNLTTWRTVILALLLSPFAVKSIRRVNVENLAYLNLGSFFGLVLGGITLYVGLSWIGAVKTSTVSAITPLFSTLLAITLLKERVSPVQALGVAFVALGIILVAAT